MILGISGKMNSGKDLTGRIIQGLSANLNHSEIKKLALDKNYRFTSDNWQIKKFSTKLKDMVCHLIGCDKEQLEDEEFKNKPLSKIWELWSISWYNPKDCNKGIKLFTTVKDASDWWDKNSDKEMSLQEVSTPRQILQLIGTEVGREIIHPNIWINSLLSSYNKDKDKWIITDVRFPNEAEAIKKNNGILIRINRTYDCTTLSTMSQHLSEIDLDNYKKWDYVIENKGSIEDLIDKVDKSILQELP